MKCHSRSRVIDHGEVFTPPELVRDMLDLPGIAKECRRTDARFLEPAYGTGNFLVEVLRRRLERVDRLPAISSPPTSTSATRWR